MAHRFKNVDIAEVTLVNVNEVLPESIFLQLEFFLPPEGSDRAPTNRQSKRI